MSGMIFNPPADPCKEKVLFLCPYPLFVAPSQRFRFEQYFVILNSKEFKITINSHLSATALKILGSPGRIHLKIIYMIKGFVSRLSTLFAVPQYDFVFIHREAYPIGPPVIEWIIAKIFKKKIIYDFDDAIWLTDKTNESSFERILRWRGKVASICRWSYKVSAGNDYLCQYASQFNNNVVKNPTTIDTERVHNPALYVSSQSEHIVIGWTGSRTTLKYLYLLEPVLQKIQEKYPHVHLLVIADQPPTMTLKKLTYKRWSKKTEISDLITAHIGIMPLPDDEWSKGKCGFKALQYMALKIPAVVSPVGINTTIVQHGVNGFLCETEKEWLDTLDLLIADVSLRKQVGSAGRKTVIEHYSVISNSANFLSLFE